MTNSIETDNLCRLKVGKLSFPELRLKPGELHKVRGYFSGQFRQYDQIHNHAQEGAVEYYYRYPMIQFKLDDEGSLSVCGYSDEGIKVLRQLFLAAQTIDVEGRQIQVNEKELESGEQLMGEDGQIHCYRFSSPWLALNQSNYQRYNQLAENRNRRRDMLHSILINNIIALSKFAGYTVRNRLTVESDFQTRLTNLKGKTHIGFIGEFRVNFLLPDGIGLGKSSSRGYGRVVKLPPSSET
jgi:hypothetical protein